jgi:hypothetical protein
MNDETVTILSPTSKQKVTVIFSHVWADDGDKTRYITTCTFLAPCGNVYSGSAICSPHDRINREYGQRLAYKRAIIDGMNRKFVPGSLHKEILAAWRKALWEARNPNGWKTPEPEPVEVAAAIPAEVETSLPY